MTDQFQKQIRKEALEFADRWDERRGLRQSTGFTLDALEEVTGLPRQELELIAEKVRISREASRDRFFSVGRQLLWVLLATASAAVATGWIGRLVWG